MAAVTHVYTLDSVATMLGETLDLLEAIVWNGDNLTYGAIVTVYTVKGHPLLRAKATSCLTRYRATWRPRDVR